MELENVSSIRLEYEILGPYWWEESIFLYEDILNAYKGITDQGFEEQDIEMFFRTDCYTCNIKNSEICLDGKITKKIDVRNKGSPELGDLLMNPVKVLKVNIKRNHGQYLQMAVRKGVKLNSYEVEAHIDNLECIEFLEKITGRLKTSIMINSKVLSDSL